MDISYLLFLQNLREATGGVFNAFFSYITTYGEELLTMMIAAAIYWCLDKGQGFFTLMTWGTGRLVNGFLKVTACAYRPWIRDARIEPVEGSKTAATGYSFPSGHTTNATAVFGSIGMNERVTKLVKWLMVAMILLVGFSRNYLGVHTPQDVLVGCGSTVALLFFMKWLLKKADQKPNLDAVILAVSVALTAAVMIYAACKTYPMDYDAEGNLIVDPQKMAIDTYKGCGFFLAVVIGWFVDRRWLHYEIKGTPMERVGYYTAAILGYFFVLYFIVKLYPSDMMGSFLVGFTRLIYVVLVAPLAIKFCWSLKERKASAAKA